MQVRRAWGAVGVVAVLLAAACTDPADGGRDPAAASSSASPSPSSSPSSSASSSAPASSAATPSVVADPEHAVEPPGPFQAPALSADMLITSAEPLREELIDRIDRLERVVGVAPISLGQVSIENRLYDVAAVDAASYRRFTERESALLQEQWDRVAGGELATLPGLRRRLPLDDGYVRMGPGAKAPLVHVGAYAPQVPTVEMVINEKWGETLGIDQRNALLVATGRTAPQAMRARIRAIVGDAGSVQLMDIATRLGLDPSASQIAVPVGTYAQAVGTFRYTVSGGRVIPDSAWVRDHIRTEVVPILGAVTCNKAIFPQLKAALADIQARGLADEIHPDEYAGCYYPRFIAGSTQLSNHAFGLALDLNVPGNQRGTVGEMDRGVVDAFKRWGFAWGGDWSYTDPMHFELSEIVAPG